MESIRLIEAQYQRDKEFRDKAEKFYDAFHKWLDVPEDKLEKKLMPWAMSGFMVNARDFIGDEEFKKLSIVLIPPEGSNLRASLSFSYTGWPVIIIRALKSERDIEGVIDRIARSTVVHEVIHLLDRMRIPVKAKSGLAAVRKGGMKAYYNSPTEWNAFWQAGANEAEIRAARTPRREFDYYFGDGTAESFARKASLHFWDQSFIENMDAVTRRKFYKRMADLWTSAIEPIYRKRMAKTESRMFEDDQQRMLRASAVDDDHRLPNVHRIIPVERLKKIPYKGESEVTIYRGIGPGDKNRIIRPGDWVALSKKYAEQHVQPGGKLLQRTVPAIDVSWAGTDENEWFYTPLRKQVAR